MTINKHHQDQSMHAIWRGILADKDVQPHEVIYELARRHAEAETERYRVALEDIASGLSVLNPYHVANEALGRAVTE